MQKIITAKCMLCDCNQLSYIEDTRDYEGNYKVARCVCCGHVQVTPLPTAQEDEKFYQNNEMSRKLRPHSEKSDLELMKHYESWADYQCDTMSKHLNRTQSILEIGSGYGWFVKKMCDKGYNVKGLELSTDKCKLAKDELGISLFNCNMLLDDCVNTINEKFDVVVLFHVLEHIVDPIQFLETQGELLKPGGTIYVEVPNFNDWAKGVDEGYRKFSYLRTHVSYYTAETLSSLLQKSGFGDVEISGVQEYSIENILNWINTSKPYLKKHQLHVPSQLEWLDKYYKQTLENRLESYALLAKAVKIK